MSVGCFKLDRTSSSTNEPGQPTQSYVQLLLRSELYLKISKLFAQLASQVTQVPPWTVSPMNFFDQVPLVIDIHEMPAPVSLLPSAVDMPPAAVCRMQSSLLHSELVHQNKLQPFSRGLLDCLEFNVSKVTVRQGPPLILSLITVWPWTVYRCHTSFTPLTSAKAEQFHLTKIAFHNSGWSLTQKVLFYSNGILQYNCHPVLRAKF